MAERDDQGQLLREYRGGKLEGWGRGMNNRRPDVDLPVDLLRNAVNVDVLTSGKVRRRKGISQVIADAGAHSVFGHDDRLLWATASALKACDRNFVARTLLTSAKFDLPLSYIMFNGVTYFSNEKINGTINQAGAYAPWGIVPPSGGPVLASLDAGKRIRQYAVTCTFVIKSGGIEIEESGAPVGNVCVGGDDGVILAASIPQPSDARVTHVRLYATDIDGQEFYQHVDLPIGVTAYTIRRPYGLGKQLRSQFLAPPPPGQLLAAYKGRIYVASGNILYFTEPLYYGAYHTARGYFMFSERITMLKASNDGIFISADYTYFIAGGQPKSAELKPLLPYKAIEGAACDVPNSNDVMWMSERGLVYGRASGAAENVTEEQMAMDYATRACLGVMELNGSKHALAVAKHSTASLLQADDFTTAEATRDADFR